MQFTVAKPALLEALQICSSAVPGKSTLQILHNFLLVVRGGELSLTATDLDMGVRMTISVDMQEAGEIVVNARKLLDIVRELPDLPVVISCKDYQLSIRSEGGFSGRLTGFDASEFPSFPEMPSDGAFSVPAGLLRTISERTLFAVSTDQTRMSLNGVFWEPRDGSMTMVATDGHRLGWARAACESAGLSQGVILPPKAINQILRVAVGEDAPVAVGLGEGMARLQAGVVEIFTKLIEGPYPNYQQVVPKSFSRVAKARREELAAAVRRVATLASAATRQIKLAFSPGRLEVSAQNLDVGGDARDSVAIDFQGEPIDMGFNANYLLEILRLVPGEDVQLKLNSPVQACVLEPTTGAEDTFFILMPLRLAD